MRESDGHTAASARHGGAEGAVFDCDATPCAPTQLADAPDSNGSDAHGPDAPGASEVSVVVLAGGASRRFGGPDDDKLAARLGGRSVLDVTLANVPRGWPIVAVGPEQPERTDQPVADGQDPTMPQRSLPAEDGERHGPDRPEAAGSAPPHVITWVQDDPPLGGPVAAIAAALPHVTTPLCAALAGDTPFGGLALPALTQAVGGHDGAQLVADDRVQPLIAVYRTVSLRTAIATISQVSGTSMRALLASLDLVTLDLAHLVTHLDPEGAARAVAQDIDTVDDLAWFHVHGIA